MRENIEQTSSQVLISYLHAQKREQLEQFVLWGQNRTNNRFFDENRTKQEQNSLIREQNKTNNLYFEVDILEQNKTKEQSAHHCSSAHKDIYMEVTSRRS